jgi:hypothetical protein
MVPAAVDIFDALEASQLARQMLGDDLHEAYIAFKRVEWDDFHNTVRQWEWDRYLTFFGEGGCASARANRQRCVPIARSTLDRVGVMFARRTPMPW